MAANAKAGASAPAIEINGHVVPIIDGMASTWRAFMCLKVVSDEAAAGVKKMDAAFEYARLVSGLDDDEIVEIAGGDMAQITDVIGVVTQIMTEASPKN